MENLIELLKKIITNVLTALYQPFWFAVILTVFLLFFYLYTYKPIDTGKGIRAAFRAWWQEFRTSLFFRKPLFADVFYSDDPVSDTDQPEYVDQSAVGYYGRLVDLAHGGRRHGHTDDGML